MCKGFGDAPYTGVRSFQFCTPRFFWFARIPQDPKHITRLSFEGTLKVPGRLLAFICARCNIAYIGLLDTEVLSVEAIVKSDVLWTRIDPSGAIGPGNW